MAWTARYTGDRELCDFVALPNGRDRVLVRRGYEDRIPEVGWWGGERHEVARTVGGRAAHPVIQLSSGEKLLVRRFRRGGAVRHVSRETYLAGHRALEELRVTVLAARRGVSVPYVIAALERPQPGFGYTAELAVRWIEGAVDLIRWLQTAGPGARDAALRETGTQIARMHNAGVSHPDLNLRNVLVGPPPSGRGPRKIYLLDFDRAAVRAGPVPRLWRWRDLARFARSAAKLGRPLTGADREAMRLGYGRGWPLS